jgi:hypothetical protein
MERISIMKLSSPEIEFFYGVLRTRTQRFSTLGVFRISFDCSILLENSPNRLLLYLTHLGQYVQFVHTLPELGIENPRPPQCLRKSQGSYSGRKTPPYQQNLMSNSLY